jgi:hypothetical protein
MSYKFGSIDLSQAFAFQTMAEDQMRARPEYQAILAYLVDSTGLTPQEVTQDIGGFLGTPYLDHQFIFTDARGATFAASVVLAMLNPMTLVLTLQEAGLVPSGPVPVFQHPTAVPANPGTALGPPSKSVGDLIPGFDPLRRELLAPYAGHVAIGTRVSRPDGLWVLTVEFMDPTGTWVRLSS